MTASTKRWVALAVCAGLLVLLVPSVAVPLGQQAWLRVSRAVVVNETTRHDFVGKPVRFLSIGGERWVRWSEQEEHAAAYHVLLLFPSAPVTDNGWSFGGDGRRHEAAQSWRVETGGCDVEVRFAARYDPVWQTVEIGDLGYSLKRGNVFVVRLGKGSRPSVTQIDTTLAEMGSADALDEAVKHKLRGDEAVQGMLKKPPPLRQLRV